MKTTQFQSMTSHILFNAKHWTNKKPAAAHGWHRLVTWFKMMAGWWQTQTAPFWSYHQVTMWLESLNWWEATGSWEKLVWPCTRFEFWTHSESVELNKTNIYQAPTVLIILWLIRKEMTFICQYQYWQHMSHWRVRILQKKKNLWWHIL